MAIFTLSPLRIRFCLVSSFSKSSGLVAFVIQISTAPAEVTIPVASSIVFTHGMATLSIESCLCAILIIIALVTPTRAVDHRSRSTSAVCFLTAIPSPQTIQFARQLARSMSSPDVFILVDNNTFAAPVDDSTTVRYLQFDDTICLETGFSKSNWAGIGRDCSAWDKALFFFASVSVHYNFVWFIEEDVFVPSVQALLSLHELYSTSADLVSPRIEYNFDGEMKSWMHWPSAPEKFTPPWTHAMVCAVGCSRRLLSAVDEYVRWRGELAFIELLFPTLAFQTPQMKVVTPTELSAIVYRANYHWEQIQRKPYDWWHPIKDRKRQQEWHDRSVDGMMIS